jgi:GTP 3',8-cyclase
MMPLGEMVAFADKHLVCDREIWERIEAAFGVLEPLGDGKLDGEARMYRIPGALGSIGLISSVSHPFCANCTRARLTADGVLRFCLLRNNDVNLLSPLRHGASIQELKQLILTGIADKPWGHVLLDKVIPTGRVMSQIGGWTLSSWSKIW